MGILLRFVLLSLLATLIVRAFWRLVGGVIAGASPQQGRRRSGPPDRGVQMVRDPICGTFLPPASAVSLTERGGAVRYFCSEKCREAFKARV
jgi:YHS domain-containing protein